MKRRWLVLIVSCLLAVTSFALVRAAEDLKKNPLAEATAANPWADEAKATALLQGYFARMKVDATLDTTEKYPMFEAPVKMKNATHQVHVVIDVKRQMVYVFLNRYLTAKPDNPQLPKVLQRLMEENWNLNVGKFEWDKTDGEVRLSFVFSTENGLGYEAFDAVVDTLLETGDKLWPELKALTEG